MEAYFQDILGEIAMRRLDQLRQAQKETVGLAMGGWASRGSSDNPQDERPTLASQGIDND